MIDLTLPSPWRKEAFSKFEIKLGREVAIERAEAARATTDIVVYSDALGRHSSLGAIAAILSDSLEITNSI
ncbi:reverse transcriptase [Penicillium taxi]|uniref:reverse transcriptase n=1 Tax=Penicillium taxi TaxID=168475 RepID=UPI0025451CA0|nr:reverse transcriptase [Penicillium taxi]KAJ5894141.1 reverse transcriptase [Penicillium taxi]